MLDHGCKYPLHSLQDFLCFVRGAAFSHQIQNHFFGGLNRPLSTCDALVDLRELSMLVHAPMLGGPARMHHL